MAKLKKIFEKQAKLPDGTRQQQELIVETSDVYSLSDVDDLQYQDFEVNLYINNKKIADIGYVLTKAGLFSPLVDDIDWHELYKEYVTREEDTLYENLK